MVAFRLMFPPSLVFVRGGWQFIIQYSFDLFKAKRNLSFAGREVTQVIFKRCIFSSHQAPLSKLSLNSDSNNPLTCRVDSPIRPRNDSMSRLDFDRLNHQLDNRPRHHACKLFLQARR